MDTFTHTCDLDEPGVSPLAGLIAVELRPGDAVALFGDLGAGKTTFARALIRAALDDDEAEVPSPTFSLSQTYDTPRLAITHFDFYRLADAAEALEIGADDALTTGAVIVEWPQRAPEVLPADRLEIAFDERDGGTRRRLRLTGIGSWASRLGRLAVIRALLDRIGWSGAHVRHLAGDASARRYMRLRLNDEIRVLMDAPRRPDGPPIRDGKPYSRIAHLAEDVVPFVAVARHLRSLGLSAPAIHATDLEAGLLLLEDLGDSVYGAAIGHGADQAVLWQAAADVLHVIRRAPVPQTGLPVTDRIRHVVPSYDRGAMQIEVELLPDWYVPAATGHSLPNADRAEFLALWNSNFDRLLALPKSLVLRDYHSPNLLLLDDRHGLARVGIIDVQDSLIGHPAYDLVSLLQDARVDVSEQIEHDVLAAYLATAGAEPGFDAASFRFAYAALGAQRNTKILGIFARLARRDGKPGYLRHIPRIWRYLERDLAHPKLSDLRLWYDRMLPPDLRTRQFTQ